MLWSIVSSAARTSLHLVSADSGERARQQRLREDFRKIPLNEGWEPAPTGSWQSNRLRLREHVVRHDTRAFLTWDVIRETMFPPPYARFAQSELKLLKRQDWTGWRRVIRESAVGLPLPSVYYLRSSANAIHHAYHLCRFETETHRRIDEFGAIVEFGGGYGSLCRITHARGFHGRYVIFDLPEQSALQRYYLDAVGIRDVLTVSDLNLLDNVMDDSERPVLFVATWSLSEAPLDVRKQIMEAVRGCDAFLIAYQSEFGGVDNRAYFRNWENGFPEVSWKNLRIDHVAESTYLFGIRNR